MSKKLLWARNCAYILPLLLAVSAFGADTTIYTSDFESDTIGAAPAGWYDIDDGAATPNPAGSVVVAGGDGDTKSFTVGDYYAGIASFTTFSNGFDVNNRQVDITFSIKGDPGKEGMATYAGWFGAWGGSIDPASTGYPFPQEMTNFNANGDWTSQTAPDVGLTPTQYDAGFQFPGHVMKDGTTWNTVRIESIVRNTNFTGGDMIGQTRVVVSYVDSSLVTQTWTSPYANFQLDSTGLTGFAAYTARNGAGNEWFIDNLSVVQRETLASAPDNFPTPDTMLPGAKATKGGGITSDGGRYFYATGGDGAGGAIYRYDVLTDTWTTLTARPTVRTQTEASGPVTYNDSDEAHGLSIDANGKIVVMAGPAQGSWPSCNNAYVYDIATDTWAPVVVGNPGMIVPPPTATAGTFEKPVCAEAVGTSTYSMIVPGQGGFTEFDTTTSLYVTGQWGVIGASPPNNKSWGADMAAVGSFLYALNGKNDATSGNGELHVFDPSAGTWAADGTLADMPVPASATQNALAYVDDKFASIVVLHGDWGLGGLYEIRIDQGGALFAAVGGTDDLFRYDIATDNWTTLTDVLPFTFADGDDICAGLLLWGDTNRDGSVNLLDLGNMADHWGDTTSVGWAEGDLNGDGVVNLLDLGIMADAWGNSLTGGGDGMGFDGAMDSLGFDPVPEPTTLCLVGLGALALVRRRRK